MITIAGTCDDVPTTKFADLLRVFNADKDAGYPKKISKTELNKNDFLARTCAILGLSDTVETAYQILLNPQHSAEAQELLCTSDVRGQVDMNVNLSTKQRSALS